MNPDRTPKTRSVWPTLRSEWPVEKSGRKYSMLQSAERHSPCAACFCIVWLDRKHGLAEWTAVLLDDTTRSTLYLYSNTMCPDRDVAVTKLRHTDGFTLSLRVLRLVASYGARWDPAPTNELCSPWINGPVPHKPWQIIVSPSLTQSLTLETFKSGQKSIVLIAIW